MRTNLNKPATLFLVLLFCSNKLLAQSVDLEKLSDLKNKGIRFSGGVTANSIFYTGNGGSIRDPFTYYLNGTLNANIAGLVDIPVSFNLTNVGSGFDFPTVPSRIGLHPRYKSITGHLGDVTMSFSPYTLNGYQFRGAGVDFTPTKGKFSFSAMGGRLQKATQYDSANQVVPAAYQRYGYGGKIDYTQKYYKVGVIVFAAKDRNESLLIPDSIDIKPQQNVTVSWLGSFMPVKDMQLSVEYATSALTRNLQDTTSPVDEKNSYLSFLLKGRNTTSVYSAVKANLNYKYKNSIIGVGYERVDPGYETLGAYFFNNDLENITVNLSQPMFKSKVQLGVNAGFQKDNLDGSKIGSNRRSVYAVNMNYTGAGKFLFTASYSNFTTFMNIRPLFQTINQPVTPFVNLDTLNYSQVSQNANLNMTYQLQKTAERNQMLNLNVNYLIASDRQGGIKQFGSNSNMLNSTASYTYMLVPKELNITIAFNSALSRIAQVDYVTMGPTVAVSKKMFKLITGSLVASYNQSSSAGSTESSVLNTRLNLGYRYKNKQNVNLSFMNQNRTLRASGTTNDFIVTLGYGYYF
jgi:hypothetical protein